MTGHAPLGDSKSPEQRAQESIIRQVGTATDDELLVARCLLTYETDRQPPENRPDWDGLDQWKRASWIIEARELIERAGRDAHEEAEWDKAAKATGS